MATDQPGSMVAVLVRHGDLIRIRGHWLELASTRLERYPTGTPAIVLLFPAHPSLRIHAGDRLTVQRHG
ncbi:hypothetical protein [Streptomyces sp. NPDC046887]|uniref:hypothetical protein n=1 Tax=Streptomyces sp. NPDC046887 TaxID=3155472 RepID=UPI0033D862A7